MVNVEPVRTQIDPLLSIFLTPLVVFCFLTVVKLLTSPLIIAHPLSLVNTQFIPKVSIYLIYPLSCYSVNIRNLLIG
jgi:hypothetical protein